MLIQIANPYSNRKAILNANDFYGRERDLVRVYGLLLSGTAVSLVGERRVGKSSLLNALDFPREREAFGIPPGFTITRIDLQYLGGDCTEEGFLDHLASRMAEVLDEHSSAGDRDDVRRLAVAARRQGRQLVIAIDEFDLLYNNKSISPYLFSFLRALASNEAVAFIVASREGHIETLVEAEGVDSSFLNIFQPVRVGPLEREDALDLIRVPARRHGIDFSDAEVELAVELGGYYPFFLQYACWHMFNLRSEGVPPETLKAEVRRLLRGDLRQHFDYIMSRLSRDEHDFLAGWSESGSKIASTGSMVEAELRARGLIIGAAEESRIFSTDFAAMLRAHDAPPPPPERTGMHRSRSGP